MKATRSLRAWCNGRAAEFAKILGVERPPRVAISAKEIRELAEREGWYSDRGLLEHMYVNDDVRDYGGLTSTVKFYDARLASAAGSRVLLFVNARKLTSRRCSITGNRSAWHADTGSAEWHVARCMIGAFRYYSPGRQRAAAVASLLFRYRESKRSEPDDSAAAELVRLAKRKKRMVSKVKSLQTRLKKVDRRIRFLERKAAAASSR